MESLATFLTDIGTVVTNVITWAGNVLTFIQSQPALMVLCIAVPLVSFGVGITNRLLRG